MYRIKKSSNVNRIRESVEIEDGSKVLHLDVDVNVDSVLRQYVEIGSQLSKLQAKLREGEKTEELYADFGRVLLAWFELFFGAEQTKLIVEFYDGRYTEMLSDITPFLQDVVVPAFVKAQTATKDWYRQLAKRGK